MVHGKLTVIKKTGLDGTSVSINDDPVILGASEEDCTICITNEDTEAQHCTIAAVGAQIFLSRMSVHKPLVLNGKPLAEGETAELLGGDILEIGKRKFRFDRSSTSGPGGSVRRKRPASTRPSLGTVDKVKTSLERHLLDEMPDPSTPGDKVSESASTSTRQSSEAENEDPGLSSLKSRTPKSLAGSGRGSKRKSVADYPKLGSPKLGSAKKTKTPSKGNAFGSKKVGTSGRKSIIRGTPKEEPPSGSSTPGSQRGRRSGGGAKGRTSINRMGLAALSDRLLNAKLSGLLGTSPLVGQLSSGDEKIAEGQIGEISELGGSETVENLTNSTSVVNVFMQSSATTTSTTSASAFSSSVMNVIPKQDHDSERQPKAAGSTPNAAGGKLATRIPSPVSGARSVSRRRSPPVNAAIASSPGSVVSKKVDGHASRLLSDNKSSRKTPLGNRQPSPSSIGGLGANNLRPSPLASGSKFSGKVSQKPGASPNDRALGHRPPSPRMGQTNSVQRVVPNSPTTMANFLKTPASGLKVASKNTKSTTGKLLSAQKSTVKTPRAAARFGFGMRANSPGTAKIPQIGASLSGSKLPGISPRKSPSPSMATKSTAASAKKKSDISIPKSVNKFFKAKTPGSVGHAPLPPSGKKSTAKKVGSKFDLSESFEGAASDSPSVFKSSKKKKPKLAAVEEVVGPKSVPVDPAVDAPIADAENCKNFMETEQEIIAYNDHEDLLKDDQRPSATLPAPAQLSPTQQTLLADDVEEMLQTLQEYRAKKKSMEAAKKSPRKSSSAEKTKSGGAAEALLAKSLGMAIDQEQFPELLIQSSDGAMSMGEIVVKDPFGVGSPLFSNKNADRKSIDLMEVDSPALPNGGLVLKPESETTKFQRRRSIRDLAFSPSKSSPMASSYVDMLAEYRRLSASADRNRLSQKFANGRRGTSIWSFNSTSFVAGHNDRNLSSTDTHSKTEGTPNFSASSNLNKSALSRKLSTGSSVIVPTGSESVFDSSQDEKMNESPYTGAPVASRKFVVSGTEKDLNVSDDDGSTKVKILRKSQSLAGSPAVKKSTNRRSRSVSGNNRRSKKIENLPNEDHQVSAKDFRLDFTDFTPIESTNQFIFGESASLNDHVLLRRSFDAAEPTDEQETDQNVVKVVSEIDGRPVEMLTLDVAGPLFESLSPQKFQEFVGQENLSNETTTSVANLNSSLLDAFDENRSPLVRRRVSIASGVVGSTLCGTPNLVKPTPPVKPIRSSLKKRKSELETDPISLNRSTVSFRNFDLDNLDPPSSTKLSAKEAFENGYFSLDDSAFDKNSDSARGRRKFTYSSPALSTHSSRRSFSAESVAGAGSAAASVDLINWETPEPGSVRKSGAVDAANFEHTPLTGVEAKKTPSSSVVKTASKKKSLSDSAASDKSFGGAAMVDKTPVLAGGKYGSTQTPKDKAAVVSSAKSLTKKPKTPVSSSKDTPVSAKNTLGDTPAASTPGTTIRNMANASQNPSEIVVISTTAKFRRGRSRSSDEGTPSSMRSSVIDGSPAVSNQSVCTPASLNVSSGSRRTTPAERLENAKSGISSTSEIRRRRSRSSDQPSPASVIDGSPDVNNQSVGTPASLDVSSGSRRKTPTERLENTKSRVSTTSEIRRRRSRSSDQPSPSLIDGSPDVNNQSVGTPAFSNVSFGSRKKTPATQKDIVASDIMTGTPVSMITDSNKNSSTRISVKSISKRLSRGEPLRSASHSPVVKSSSQRASNDNIHQTKVDANCSEPTPSAATILAQTRGMLRHSAHLLFGTDDAEGSPIFGSSNSTPKESSFRSSRSRSRNSSSAVKGGFGINSPKGSPIVYEDLSNNFVKGNDGLRRSSVRRRAELDHDYGNNSTSRNGTQSQVTSTVPGLDESAVEESDSELNVEVDGVVEDSWAMSRSTIDDAPNENTFGSSRKSVGRKRSRSNSRSADRKSVSSIATPAANSYSPTSPLVPGTLYDGDTPSSQSLSGRKRSLSKSASSGSKVGAQLRKVGDSFTSAGGTLYSPSMAGMSPALSSTTSDSLGRSRMSKSTSFGSHDSPSSTRSRSSSGRKSARNRTSPSLDQSSRNETAYSPSMPPMLNNMQDSASDNSDRFDISFNSLESTSGLVSPSLSVSTTSMTIPTLAKTGSSPSVLFDSSYESHFTPAGVTSLKKEVSRQSRTPIRRRSSTSFAGSVKKSNTAVPADKRYFPAVASPLVKNSGNNEEIPKSFGGVTKKSASAKAASGGGLRISVLKKNRIAELKENIRRSASPMKPKETSLRRQLVAFRRYSLASVVLSEDLDQADHEVVEDSQESDSFVFENSPVDQNSSPAPSSVGMPTPESPGEMDVSDWQQSTPFVEVANKTHSKSKLGSVSFVSGLNDSAGSGASDSSLKRAPRVVLRSPQLTSEVRALLADKSAHGGGGVTSAEVGRSLASPILTGIRELVATPKTQKDIASLDLSGVAELMSSVSRKSSSRSPIVRTRASGSGRRQSGLKRMSLKKTPEEASIYRTRVLDLKRKTNVKSPKSPALVGIRELFRNPKSVGMRRESDRLSGVAGIFAEDAESLDADERSMSAKKSTPKQVAKTPSNLSSTRLRRGGRKVMVDVGVDPVTTLKKAQMNSRSTTRPPNSVRGRRNVAVETEPIDEESSSTGLEESAESAPDTTVSESTDSPMFLQKKRGRPGRVDSSPAKKTGAGLENIIEIDNRVGAAENETLETSNVEEEHSGESKVVAGSKPQRGKRFTKVVPKKPGRPKKIAKPAAPALEKKNEIGETTDADEDGDPRGTGPGARPRRGRAPRPVAKKTVPIKKIAKPATPALEKKNEIGETTYADEDGDPQGTPPGARPRRGRAPRPVAKKTVPVKRIVNIPSPGVEKQGDQEETTDVEGDVDQRTVRTGSRSRRGNVSRNVVSKKKVSAKKIVNISATPDAEKSGDAASTTDAGEDVDDQGFRSGSRARNQKISKPVSKKAVPTTKKPASKLSKIETQPVALKSPPMRTKRQQRGEGAPKRVSEESTKTNNSPLPGTSGVRGSRSPRKPDRFSPSPTPRASSRSIKIVDAVSSASGKKSTGKQMANNRSTRRGKTVQSALTKSPEKSPNVQTLGPAATPMIDLAEPSVSSRRGRPKKVEASVDGAEAAPASLKGRSARGKSSKPKHVVVVDLVEDPVEMTPGINIEEEMTSEPVASPKKRTRGKRRGTRPSPAAVVENSAASKKRGPAASKIVVPEPPLSSVKRQRLGGKVPPIVEVDKQTGSTVKRGRGKYIRKSMSEPQTPAVDEDEIVSPQKRQSRTKKLASREKAVKPTATSPSKRQRRAPKPRIVESDHSDLDIVDDGDVDLSAEVASSKKSRPKKGVTPIKIATPSSRMRIRAPKKQTTVSAKRLAGPRRAVGKVGSSRKSTSNSKFPKLASPTKASSQQKPASATKSTRGGKSQDLQEESPIQSKAGGKRKLAVRAGVAKPRSPPGKRMTRGRLAQTSK